MKRYIKSSGTRNLFEVPMYRVLVTLFDSGQIIRKSFDTWQECEDWLSWQGYDDPNMFTDDPETNQTGVYVECIPKDGARKLDPYFDKFLTSQGC